MQVHRLTRNISATNSVIDQANKQHDSATHTIVSLKQDDVDLKANAGVVDELKLTSGSLVTTQDELACEMNELEKRNDTTREVKVELKETKRSKRNMTVARENLNLATEDIRSKANAHDDSVDRLSTATTSLYLATQDKFRQDAEVAEMASDLVRMRHQLNESALAHKALKEELLDRNTELMDVQEHNHLLNGMQMN
jgi:chromosome segregation ATPase